METPMFTRLIEEPGDPGASICVLAVKYAEYCHGHDLKIEGETPVAQVIEVVLDALRNGGVAAPAVDLGPSRDADFEEVARIVLFHSFQMAFNEVRHFGAGTDDAHVSPQDIEELR